MHVLKWILISLAGLFLLALLTITPLAWLGFFVFLFGVYQMIRRNKGKTSFSKPGTIMTMGFLLSFILALIFVEPSTEVQKVTEEIAVNEDQENEDVAVDKSLVSENEIAPGSQIEEEEPTEDQIASEPETETEVKPTTPPPSPTKPGGNLSVHFLNVGQGDAILIQAPNGKTMLVDGGPRGVGDEVVAYLRTRGISSLDYVVATHPDADHIGGLIDVLHSLNVKQMIDSGKAHTTETYYELLSLVDTKNIDYIVPNTGDTFPLDNNLTTTVIYANDDASDNNDASIVLQLTYNNVSFLLMGDADTGIENSLVANRDVNATVLKAGHHGSDTSSSSNFLNEVTPEIAILSYGENNSYGHPDGAVISRLNNLGAKIYHTPYHCNIIVTTNGITYDTSTSCQKTKSSQKENLEKPVSKPPETSQPTRPSGQTNFQNCTALREVYPDGVSKDHIAYQSKMDRDKDGWACE